MHVDNGEKQKQEENVQFTLDFIIFLKYFIIIMIWRKKYYIVAWEFPSSHFSLIAIFTIFPNDSIDHLRFNGVVVVVVSQLRANCFISSSEFKRRNAHSTVSGMNHFFYNWLLFAAPLFQKLQSLPLAPGYQLALHAQRIRTNRLDEI
ncbi:hypothetical protein T11_16252 [Trichinella zimbabwensis]|uniref:Uncharacterized protein n=1 Tax=Trichinella zimbabwensis TaxID=268475 RepID=A0A0V1H275_9BILA|nr:hypothetical protein T11_16252 [Trichinella zimbabwensis]